MNTRNKEKRPSVAFTVRTSRETKEKLDTLAESMGRSTNYLADEALAAYVAENAWQMNAIQQAIEEADQDGQFYRHEDVMAYFEARARGENPGRPEPLKP